MEKDMPSENETLQEVGRLLFITQQAEHYISILIGMAFPETKPSWDELAKLNKNTLGSLIKKLKERVDMPDSFVELLEAFLQKRNFFIHELSRQEWFNTQTEEGRDELWNFLESYQISLFELHNVVVAAIFRHSEKIGAPESEYDKQLKESGYLDVIKSYYAKSDVAFKGRKP